MKTKKIKLEEALNHIDKTFSEVEEFSDELKETVHYLCNK